MRFAGPVNAALLEAAGGLLDGIPTAAVPCWCVPIAGARGARMAKPIISADSHVTEPPGTYVDRIDRRFRDRAPHVVRDPVRGDLFVIEGMDKPIPMGLVAAAGKPADTL